MDEICYLVSGKLATKEFTAIVPVKKADIDEVEFFDVLKKYICDKLEEAEDETVIFYSIINFTKLTREIQK
jgi:hypothetical protein